MLKFNHLAVQQCVINNGIGSERRTLGGSVVARPSQRHSHAQGSAANCIPGLHMASPPGTPACAAVTAWTTIGNCDTMISICVCKHL